MALSSSTTNYHSDEFQRHVNVFLALESQWLCRTSDGGALETDVSPSSVLRCEFERKARSMVGHLVSTAVS